MESPTVSASSNSSIMENLMMNRMRNLKSLSKILLSPHQYWVNLNPHTKNHFLMINGIALEDFVPSIKAY